MSDQSSSSKNNRKMAIGSEVLQSLFENGKSPLSGQFLRWKLWARWKDVVGPTMAEHTEPVWYDKGTLYLWVKTSAWMQQLVFMRDPVKVKINSYLRQTFVRDIKFTMDRREVPRGYEGDALKDQVQKLVPESFDSE